MSTFSLSQTGTEINSAIGKVHNADTTPTQGSTNMVTSDGVYTAVTNVDVSALPITTAAEGIANYDNDDNVPTNAAVKDYVDSKTGGVATYSAPNIITDAFNIDPINISEESDLDNIGSLSNSVIDISAGLYFIDLALNAGNRYSYNIYTYYIKINNSVRNKDLPLITVSNTSDTSAPYPEWHNSTTFYVPVNTQVSVKLVREDVRAADHYMNNFLLTLLKIR
jgi:hypothetical protein